MKQKDRNKPCKETWINGLYEDKDLNDDFCHGFAGCKVKDRCEKYRSGKGLGMYYPKFVDKDGCKFFKDKKPSICGVPIQHMVKCPMLFEHEPCDLVTFKDCKSCRHKRYIYIDRVDCTYEA
jgi:hypothetical protein